MLFKKSYIFLIIFIFLLSISAINAQELDNDTGISQISSEIDDKGLYESYNPGSFNELYTLINNAENGSTINLEKDYVLDDISKSNISINKKIILDGNNHLISSKTLDMCFIIETDNVILKNINFNNFQSRAITWYGNNGNLDSCIFINNSAIRAGAVFWRGDNGVINNCQFYDNAAYKYSAGAVYWVGSYGILNNCKFFNNIAYNFSGGAVYWGGSFGILNNLEFYSNSGLTANSIYYGGRNGNIMNCICYVNNTYCRIDDFESEINLNNQFYNNKKIFEIYDSSIFEGLNVAGNEINIKIDNLKYDYNDSSVTFEIYAYDKYNNFVPVDCIYTYYEKLERFDVKNNKVTIQSSDDYLKYNVIIPIQVVLSELNLFKPVIVNIEREVDLFYLYIDELDPEVHILSNINFNSKAIVKVNGVKYLSEFKNGILELKNMFSRGNFSIEVELDDPFLSGYKNFNVFFKKGRFLEENIFNLTGNDLKAYYKNCKYSVKLIDYNGNPKANEKLTFYLNDMVYNRTTNKQGVASLDINLNSGNYNIQVKCLNDDFKVNTLNNKITILSTISSNDITKIYKNGTQYYSKFVDSNGNPLKNTNVKFNINGVFYTRTTNDNGIAKMNINLNPGDYIITAENLKTGEKLMNNINVLPSIIENNDLEKYYRNNSQYLIKVIGSNGKPVGYGEKITFNINGVFYTRITDSFGHVKLNINLIPGKYIITAEYKGFKVSNTIKVKSVLSANNLNMKYKDGSQFKVKVFNGQGKSLTGATVSFNINGVFYDRVSDSSGYARLNINLLPGNYIITSMYNGLSISNTVKVNSKYETNPTNAGSSSSQSIETDLCSNYKFDSNAFVELKIYTGNSYNAYYGKTNMLGKFTIPIKETVNEVHKIEIKVGYTGLNYKKYSGSIKILPGGYILEDDVYYVGSVDPSKIPLSDIKIYT